MITKYEVTKKDSDTGMAILKLVEGPYKNTTFSFGKIKFGEEQEDGNVPLHFDYVVYEGYGIEEPTDEFETVVGDILVSLIENMAEIEKAKGLAECKE